MCLHTKNGRPLQVLGNTVYSQSGKVVGRFDGDRVFGKGGDYVGTVVGNRLVFRPSDSAKRGRPFSASNLSGCGMVNTSGADVAGEEPEIPD